MQIYWRPAGCIAGYAAFTTPPGIITKNLWNDSWVFIRQTFRNSKTFQSRTCNAVDVYRIIHRSFARPVRLEIAPAKRGIPDATSVTRFPVSISKIFPCRSERKLFYEPSPTGAGRGLKSSSPMKKHAMFVRIAAIKSSEAPSAAISAKLSLTSIRKDTEKKIKTFNSHNKLVSKLLGLARGQGVVRFKSGAYTIVREHFEPVHNAVIGQEMIVLKPV